MEMEIKNKKIKKVLDIISKYTDQYGYEAYLVGGIVRDMVQGKETDDIDILIDKYGDNNPAISFVNLIEGKPECSDKAVYETFGVGKVEILGYKVEFVMPRTEKYIEENRNPEVKKVNIKEDALRRDFTCNTLMINIKNNEILDPTGKGLADIEKRVLRSANPYVDGMIYDDPLRMLRAIRFMVQKEFEITEDLLSAIHKNKNRIEIISKERIKEELNKILLANKPSKAFEIMGATGLLSIILPEVFELTKYNELPPHHFLETTYRHTMRTVDNIRPELYMRLAALFHDVGKPDTFSYDSGKNKIHYYDHHIVGAKKVKNIMLRLKFSNNEIKIISKLIWEHMRPHFYNKKWRDKSIRKFIVDSGELCEDIIQLVEADVYKQNESKYLKDMKKIKEFRERIKEVKNKPDKPIKIKPILNGNDFMKIFSRKSGKWIKPLIDYTIEMQMENPNITKEEVIKNINKIGINNVSDKVKEWKEKYSKPFIRGNM